MPDVFTKEKRSQVMAKIRSKGSKIEMEMKDALEKNKIDFVYQPKLFGKPDFLILPNIAIFCDSSFWHGRNWKKLKPKLSEQYWQGHIQNNKARDIRVNKTLRKNGYVVIRFWDNEIMDDSECCVKKIQGAIQKSNLTNSVNPQ
jgi:DNA mismatch endonuclease, patch repair protein